MSLYRTLPSNFDAGAMFAQIANEIVDREARVALIATRRDHIRRGKVAIDGCEKLRRQFCEMTPDKRPQFVGLVTALEKCFDLGYNGMVGFQKAFGRHARFNATAREVE